MHDFNGVAGAESWGSLILSGGILYGMTFGGGVHSIGCIFSIHTNGSQYKDIFDFGGYYGGEPTGSLILSGKKMYGMTEYWGANNYGCIFLIDTNGVGYVDAFDFADSNGAYPQGGLTLYGNELYGMSFKGGMKNDGVIFKMNFLTAGIGEANTQEQEAILYPNPNNGQFIIQMPASYEPISNGHIEVYNVLGKSIYEEPLINSKRISINLGANPTGIYFYRISSGVGGLISEGKFIIQ